MADEIAAFAKTLRGIRRDLGSLDSRVEDAETKLEAMKKPETKPEDSDDGNPFK
jgi:hypothetical protein